MKRSNTSSSEFAEQISGDLKIRNEKPQQIPEYFLAKISRMTILFLLGYGLLSCDKQEQKAPEKTPPNIIFILADDLGWRDVGFNGSKFYETPVLDSLANEGIQFTNAYANAPNCAPTRASIMSGQYTFRHEVLTVHQSDKGDRKAQELVPVFGIDTLKQRILSIPEMLKIAGYHTAHFGKWHLGNDPQSGPKAHGFDINVGGWEKGSPKSYFSPYKNPELKDGPEGEQLTDRLTDEVIKYLDYRKDVHEPFFINFWTYGVHAPLQTKEELVKKYEAKETVDRQTNATYAGMIETLDDNIGRLVKKLEENKQLDNTIILFFSDNGGSWKATYNDPLKGCKGTLYEGGVREPAFVFAPGLFEGKKVIEQPIISTDFYPTFMDWAGVDQEPNQVLDGKSLTGLINGQQWEERPIFWYMPVFLPARGYANNVYAFRNIPGAAMRKGNYKLIWYYNETFGELYDLSTDIGEEIDLREAKPKIYKEMMMELNQWHDQNEIVIPNELNPLYDSVYVLNQYKQLRVN